jgi:hypothetical protein
MSRRTPVKVRARTKNWRASGRRNRYSRALVQFHTRKQQVVVAATRREPKASVDAALGCTPQRRALEVSVRLDQQAPRALKIACDRPARSAGRVRPELWQRWPACRRMRRGMLPHPGEE